MYGNYELLRVVVAERTDRFRREAAQDRRLKQARRAAAPDTPAPLMTAGLYPALTPAQQALAGLRRRQLEILKAVKCGDISLEEGLLRLNWES